MGNVQLKILSGILVLLLLVLLWVQHKLNAELSSQLSLAKQEITDKAYRFWYQVWGRRKENKYVHWAGPKKHIKSYKRNQQK